MDQFAFTLVLDFGSIISGIFNVILLLAVILFILWLLKEIFAFIGDVIDSIQDSAKKRKKAKKLELAKKAVGEELKRRYPEIREAVTKEQLKRKRESKKKLRNDVVRALITLVIMVAIEAILIFIGYQDNKGKDINIDAIYMLAGIDFIVAFFVLMIDR